MLKEMAFSVICDGTFVLQCDALFHLSEPPNLLPMHSFCPIDCQFSLDGPSSNSSNTLSYSFHMRTLLKISLLQCLHLNNYALVLR
jgi:hypothetical protein